MIKPTTTNVPITSELYQLELNEIDRLRKVMLEVQLILEGGDLLCELTAVSKLRIALLINS